MPFNRVADAILDGSVDAGVLIHEELINYAEQPLRKLCCLGKRWYEHVGLPLPVGLNVARRALGSETIRNIETLIHRSMGYALDHPTEAMNFARNFGRGPASKVRDEFVAKFANDDTLLMPQDVREGLRTLFEKAWSEPRKYYGGPKKKTGEGGKFSIIIDPSKCKGCAECVTVCDDDALKMVNKTDGIMDDIQKTHRMFKEFGPSDEKYINDNLLIDMMLKEETHVYVGGAGSCAGCGEGTALRMMCSATGAKHGNDWAKLAKLADELGAG